MEYVSTTEEDGIVTFKCVESSTGKTTGNVVMDFNRLINIAEKMEGTVSEEKSIQLVKSINLTIQEQIENLKSGTSGMSDYLEINNLKEYIKDTKQEIKNRSDRNKVVKDSTPDFSEVSKYFIEEFWKVIPKEYKKQKISAAVDRLAGRGTEDIIDSRSISNLLTLSSENPITGTFYDNVGTVLNNFKTEFYMIKFDYEDLDKSGLKNDIQSVINYMKETDEYKKWQRDPYDNTCKRDFFNVFYSKLKEKSFFDRETIVLKGSGRKELVIMNNDKITNHVTFYGGSSDINIAINPASYVAKLETSTINKFKNEVKKLFENSEFSNKLTILYDGEDVAGLIKELNEKVKNKEDELGLVPEYITNNFFYKDGEAITDVHTSPNRVVKNVAFSDEDSAVLTKILEDASNGVYTYAGKILSLKGVKSNKNFEWELSKLNDAGLNIFDFGQNSSAEKINFYSELRKYYENAFKKQLDESALEKLKETFIDAEIAKRSIDTMPMYGEESNVTYQQFLDINNYYDLYTINTPYILLKFKGDGGKYYTIDSVKTPFIKSLNVKDNGARTFEINLYDRDFNSLLKVRDDKGNVTEEKTIEEILIECLGSNSQEVTVPEDSEIKYMKLKEDTFGNVAGFKDAKGEKKGNLIIQYGYTDYNPAVEELFSKKQREEMAAAATGAYARLGGSKDGTIYGTRKKSSSGYSGIAEDGRKTRGERWWETSTDASTETNRTIMNQVNSSNNSTIRSTLTQCIITGYETRFSEGGIYYSIKAIEFSDSKLTAYKIFQRHTNLVGTPKELMYMTMNIIEGLFKDNGLKILYCGDVSDIIEPTEIDQNGETVVKQYQLNLGNLEARSMYKKDGDEVKLSLVEEIKGEKKNNVRYKSVKSLISELCAIMPPYEEKRSNEVKVTDEEGNTTEAVAAQKTYRRMTYAYIDNIIYLYYQRPQKVKSIRRYNWGPANAKKTVVKNIDIKTQNEFSLLSSMKFITKEKTDSGYIYKENIITRDGVQVTKNGKVDVNNGIEGADYLPNGFTSADDTKKEISMAYAQALYKGKLTILGDPFYNFGKFLQPYSYPIFIDLKLPRTEYNGNRNDWDKKSGYSHYLSGFYVVTGIEHSLSTSGFITTLDVMSYASLPKDVLVNFSDGASVQIL